jgi:hypothetical protein
MRWLVPVAALAACAGPSPPNAVAPGIDRTASAPVSAAAEPDTQSPQPGTTGANALADECPSPDAALERVARSLADGYRADVPALDASEVEERLRQEGGPYVWPHAWTLAGRGDLRQAAAPRLRAWLDSWSDAGERRCGLAVVESSGGHWVVAAVAADALADLGPVPAHVRIGSWVEVHAEMRVPFSGAKVVVLGPRGAPKAVPTAVNGQSIRARFAADAEGPWLVQVLADVEHGPRPVLEAALSAGEGARSNQINQPAPGEDTQSPDVPADALLFQMLGAARKSEGMPVIAREKRLDQLALAQALALSRAQRVAHDLGDGDPEARVAASGLVLSAV